MIRPPAPKFLGYTKRQRKTPSFHFQFSTFTLGEKHLPNCICCAMNDHKRPRKAFQSSSVCEISTETPQKQLSIRSFFGQKSGKTLVTPATTPHRSKPLETPPTATGAVKCTPPSSDETESKEGKTNGNNDRVNGIKSDRNNKKRRLAQVFIDCGQKNFGQTVCTKCGTLYVPGVPEDEKMHRRACKQISQGVSWASTTNCKIIRRNPDAKSCIVQIRPMELKKHKAKLEQILNIVERDLGMHASSSNTMVTSNGGTIFLFVMDQKVMGYLAVNSVSTAYRMLNLYERDTKPISCMLGVAVLWTHPKVRNQGKDQQKRFIVIF